VVLCTNAQPPPGGKLGALLTAWGVPVRTEPVARIEGRLGQVERVVFDGTEALARSAVPLRPSNRQQSDLAAQLGCALLIEDRSVQADELGQTTTPGVWAAGDMCHTPGRPHPATQVGMAAADGARAAVAIDRQPAMAEFGLPGDRAHTPHS
jgi:thioredoxin reductase